jgi:hypothetical protein
MAIQFVGKDPESPTGSCPAVFIDESTGDFLMQGSTVTDPDVLARVSQDSPVLEHETVVRLPARMRAMILEACGERERTVI